MLIMAVIDVMCRICGIGVCCVDDPRAWIIYVNNNYAMSNSYPTAPLQLLSPCLPFRVRVCTRTSKCPAGTENYLPECTGCYESDGSTRNGANFTLRSKYFFFR